MKTLNQAAKDYSEITNVFNSVDSKIVEESFLKGAEFANKWIDIDDELPNDRDIVLIYVNNKFKTVGCYNYIRDLWYFYDFSENEFYELSKNDIVLFWKPINV